MANQIIKITLSLLYGSVNNFWKQTIWNVVLKLHAQKSFTHQRFLHIYNNVLRLRETHTVVKVQSTVNTMDVFFTLPFVSLLLSTERIILFINDVHAWVV